MTSVAVIGSGNIGRTVGEAWKRAGHDVTYGSRSPNPPESVPIADAIAHAEVVLLATPGAAVPQLLADHGAALDGRVVIDATNDLSGDRLHHTDAYRESAPGARLVRAFNTVGWEVMANPSVGGETADLYWCGPDDAGVEQLITDVGLHPVRVGDLEAIDVVDGVCRLWLTLVFRQGHPRRLAFHLLTDQGVLPARKPCYGVSASQKLAPNSCGCGPCTYATVSSVSLYEAANHLGVHVFAAEDEDALLGSGTPTREP